MYFSPKTVIAVAALAAASTEAAVIHERGTSSSSISLCNKANYGATGYPWQSSSTPGSFCSKTKPSNSAAWSAIPYADGYDTVKCSQLTWSWTTWSWVKGGGIAVCNGGNKATTIPSGSLVPHKVGSSVVYLWNLACKGKTSTLTQSNTKTTSTTTKASSTTAKSTSTASSFSTSSPCSSSTGAASSASSASLLSASSVAASSSNTTVLSGSGLSSAAPSSVISSSAAVSSAVPSSASSVSSSSVTSTTPSGTSSSSAAAATTTSPVDPSTAPLCEADFQVQYLNFTTVALNGVWTGMTVGAAVQDASYMTYTLATSIDDCLAACDNIEGCVFVNTYYDTNPTETDLPKHAPGVLTCAMYSTCPPTSENNNWGGQDDPNYIQDSNGYCKSASCAS